MHAYDGGAPVTAVAFVSPPERQIREGLPPISRHDSHLKAFKQCAVLFQ